MQSWFGTGRSAPAAPASRAAGAAAAAKGEPLLLIKFDEDAGSWSVNPDAAAALERVPAPLCVVTVCGRARQGKSFLLNTMLGRLTGQEVKGFTVSPTQHSCTRGLWVWSSPVPIQDADGRPCNLVFMDCEGIDAVDQDSQHSAQIFCLSVLLSTVFVYNQLGAIDAIALERLAMVCELAKRIRGRGGSAAPAAASFIWLMRDFQLQLASASGGGPASPQSYLEDTLADVRGGADDGGRNEMRGTVRAVFPDRDAFTLVRPMLLEEDLARLDSIPYAKMRPEFQKGMEGFMQLVASKAHPLSVGGQLVSGRALVQLAHAYVEALNKGAVPQVVTAFQGVARAECQKAFDAALATFQGAFGEGAADGEAALFDAYQTALSSAMRGFKQAALGDAALTGEFEERLRKSTEEVFTAARDKLRAASEAATEALLASEAGKLRAVAEAPGASVADVQAELQRFLSEFEGRVVGAAGRYRRVAEFLAGPALAAVRSMHEAAVTERDNAWQRAAAADKNAAMLKAAAGRAAEAEGRVEALERQLAAAQDAAAQAHEQLAAQGQAAGRVGAEAAELRAALQAARAAVSEAERARDAAVVEAQAAAELVAQLQAQLAEAQAAVRDQQHLAQGGATPPRGPPGSSLFAAPRSPLSPRGEPVLGEPGDLAAAVAALPDDLGALTLAELKSWVVENRLEDEEYMKLAAGGRTKKAQWVEYVRKRAGLPA